MKTIFIPINRSIFIALTLAALLSPAACKPAKPGVEKKLSAEQVVQIAYAPEKSPADARARVVKRVNLDEEKDLEYAAVIRVEGQERFVILKKQKGKWKTIRSVDFALKKPGKYVYKGKKWVRESDEAGNIIQAIKINPVGEGVKHNSVLLEYLREAPENGNVSSELMAFTRTRLSYDSVSALAKHDLVRKGRRVTWNFIKGALYLFPEDQGYRSELRYNGRELILWYPGEPLPYYMDVRLLPAKTAGEPAELLVQILNKGDFSSTSYISLSFPGGGEIKPISKRGVALYKKGARIFNVAGTSIRASYPLLEVTKQGWRPLFRTRIRFTWKPAQGEGEPKEPIMLVRIVSQLRGEKQLSPMPASAVPTVKDQQGYQAYAFRLNPAGMGSPAAVPKR